MLKRSLLIILLSVIVLSSLYNINVQNETTSEVNFNMIDILPPVSNDINTTDALAKVKK
jgi:hypothetical protein